MEKQGFGKGQWEPGQVMITEVSFFDEETAKKLTRFINRHRPGQASKKGNHVIVGALPVSEMKKAYLAIGAVPEHEWTR